MMTYALMFNIENIAGSIYLNLMLTGVIRYITGGIISMLEVKCPKVGRKAIHFGVLSINAICLLTFVVVIVTGKARSTDHTWARGVGSDDRPPKM